MKRFALVGNPNCGKTTLFNSLTGSTAHVGNWPGVTVDKREGTCKLGKEEASIVDLPGIYSLSPYTSEEVITRNYIIDEKPDCLINIIDTTNLERNLYLTTQILEMDVPIVIALNMMDLLEKNGDKIDVKALEKQIGLPVVAISALKENNLKDLMDAANEASYKERKGESVLKDSLIWHLIKDLSITFHTLDVSNPLFHASKLAELDELEAANHPQFVHMVEHFREENVDSKFNIDYEALIADSRYKYITAHFSPCLVKNKNLYEAKKQDKIDRVLTHKIWGLPIFAVILFLIFHLVFAENLFFLGGLFSNVTPCFEGTTFEGMIYTSGGINSPGVILANALTGCTDWISEQVANLLVNAPEWVSGLICDGVLGGVFAVIGFLPQILLLFLLFSILEDSGYMARVAFILDRLFRKFGLSGRAFLPMIMGFGCSVPAMINTRTIADEKEKLATVRVIPFFSCGAKLPILTAIAGCIAQSFGFANVDIITLCMYVLGMVTAVVAVLLMRKTTLHGQSSPFIMELPAYHMPQFKSTMLLVWDKAKHFIKKAFTIILASTIVIWFISHFNWDWQPLSDEQMAQSILASIGKFIKPLFIPLGFGIGEYGYVFVVAAITGLIAKENVVATIGTLSASVLSSYSSINDPSMSSLVNLMAHENSFFNAQALLAFIAFNMLTIPCFAAVATARGETNKKEFKGTLLFWLVTSYFVSSAIYLIGTWFWTAFIYVAVIIIVVLIIRFIDKKRVKKNKEKEAI